MNGSTFPSISRIPSRQSNFVWNRLARTREALIGIIGQRTRVYEVMGGKRPLSLKMIRNLHDKLDIPAEVLIRTGTEIPQARCPWGVEPAQATWAAQVGLAGDGDAGRLGPFDALDARRLAPTDFFRTLRIPKGTRYFQHLRPLSEPLLRFLLPVYEQVPSRLGSVLQGNRSKNVVQVAAKEANLRKEGE